MANVLDPRDPVLAAGSWRLELRFQATRDELADYSHFWPSLPWLRELSSRDLGDLCEDLRHKGVALLSCEGPEEAARLLSQVCGRRVTARVLEPDGTELRPAEGTAKQRGVYATPRELTRFVVRSVDTLLRGHLGLEGGLAHRAVRLLDPAAGPMNFILEAYRRAVADHRRTHGREGLGSLLQGICLPASVRR